jgi:hypothetical protein
MSFLTNPPSVNFAAADFSASAGQTLQIPITAKIFGNYPLRVLMLNLSVEPLDGSPALTSPVQFTPNVGAGHARYVVFDRKRQLRRHLAQQRHCRPDRHCDRWAP